MKIDESNYDVFYEINNKFSNIDTNIVWKDTENIEGNIAVEDMYNIIIDLYHEYSLLEEKHQDLLTKIKERLQKKKHHEFMLEMIDHWDEKDRLADDLVSEEIKSLNSFLDNEN